MKSKLTQKFIAISVSVAFLSALITPLAPAYASTANATAPEAVNLDSLVTAHEFVRNIPSQKSSLQVLKDSVTFLKDKKNIAEAQKSPHTQAKLNQLLDQTKSLGNTLRVTKAISECQADIKKPFETFHAIMISEDAGNCSQGSRTPESQKTMISSLTNLSIAVEDVESHVSLREFTDQLIDESMGEYFRNYWAYKGSLGEQMPSAEDSVSEVMANINGYNKNVIDIENIDPYNAPRISASTPLRKLKYNRAHLEKISNNLKEEQININRTKKRAKAIASLQDSINRIKEIHVQQKYTKQITNHVRQQVWAVNNQNLDDNSFLSSFEQYAPVLGQGQFELSSPVRISQNFDQGLDAVIRFNQLEASSRGLLPSNPQALQITNEQQALKNPIENFFSSVFGERPDHSTTDFFGQYKKFTQHTPQHSLLGRRSAHYAFLNVFPSVPLLNGPQDNSTSVFLENEFSKRQSNFHKKIEHAMNYEMGKNPLLFTEPLFDFMQDLNDDPTQNVTITDDLFNQALSAQQERIKSKVLRLAKLREKNPQAALQAIIDEDPIRVFRLLSHHPELTGEVCAAYSQIKKDQDFKKAAKKVAVWAGAGFGAIALLTGVGALVGLGLYGATASVATAGTVAAGAGLIAGVAITPKEISDAIDHNHAYQKLSDRIISDVKSDGQDVQTALLELDEFHFSVTMAVLSGAFTTLDAYGVVVGVKSVTQMRHAKRLADEAATAALNAAKQNHSVERALLQKLDIADVALEDPKLIATLKSAAKGENIPDEGLIQIKQRIIQAINEAEASGYKNTTALYKLQDQLLSYNPSQTETVVLIQHNETVRLPSTTPTNTQKLDVAVTSNIRVDSGDIPQRNVMQMRETIQGEKIASGSQISVYNSKAPNRVIKIFSQSDTSMMSWEDTLASRRKLMELGHEDILPKIDEVYVVKKTGQGTKVIGYSEEKVVPYNIWKQSNPQKQIDTKKLKAAIRDARAAGLDIEFKPENWGVKPDGTAVIFDIDDMSVLIRKTVKRLTGHNIQPATRLISEQPIGLGDILRFVDEDGFIRELGNVSQVHTTDGVTRGYRILNPNRGGFAIDVTSEFAESLTRQPSIIRQAKASTEILTQSERAATLQANSANAESLDAVVEAYRLNVIEIANRLQGGTTIPRTRDGFIQAAGHIKASVQHGGTPEILNTLNPDFSRAVMAGRGIRSQAEIPDRIEKVTKGIQTLRQLFSPTR